MNLPPVPSDPFTLPPRIPMPMVLALAGYSRSTLSNRQRDGKMPKPIDRGGSGGIYDRDEVLKALSLLGADERAPDHDPWDVNLESLRRRLERKPKKALR